jgi:hypothetical protein
VVVLTLALTASTAAASVSGSVHAMPDPEEAPPSGLGLFLSTSLLLIVIVTVGTAIRIARKRRGEEHISQRQRYGAETEDLVAEIASAWAEGNEHKLSELISSRLMHQWSPRLPSTADDHAPSLRVDRIHARFVGREHPGLDEDDRVVIRVRARWQLHA